MVEHSRSSSSKTLYLSPGMGEAALHMRMDRAARDGRYQHLHIVGLPFDHPARMDQLQYLNNNNDKNDGLVTTTSSSSHHHRKPLFSMTRMLEEMLWSNPNTSSTTTTTQRRVWKSIKLSGCTGRTDLALSAILSANVQNLVVSLTSTTPCFEASLEALAKGLADQKNNDDDNTCPHLQSLCLHRTNLSSTQACLTLAAGLASASSLMEVKFYKVVLGPTCVRTLVQGMVTGAADGCHCRRRRLQSVTFKYCRLTDQDVQALAETILVSSSISIRELNLEGNRITTQGMQYLGQALSSPSCALRLLDLSDQEASELDVSFLGQALQVNQTLTCLTLSENSLTASGLTALCFGLRTNASVKLLHLAWTSLTTAVLEALGEMLTYNATVKQISLYECGLSNITALTSRLGQSRGLKVLDLGGHQNLHPPAFQHLLEALDNNNNTNPDRATNTTLQELSLRPGLVSRKDHRQLAFLLDLNRGGRQCLGWTKPTTAALIPHILARVNRLELSSQTSWCFDDGTRNRMNHRQRPVIMDFESIGEEEAVGIDNNLSMSRTMERLNQQRKASIMYYFLQNGILCK